MQSFKNIHVPGPPDNQQATTSGRYFPAPSTNIWPSLAVQPLPAPDVFQQEPPQSQIIGDLPILQLPEIKEPPPNISKEHYNSLLFLSRLLRTQDNLRSYDIISMQKSEPLFNQLIEKYNEYKLGRNFIPNNHPHQRTKILCFMLASAIRRVNPPAIPRD